MLNGKNCKVFQTQVLDIDITAPFDSDNKTYLNIKCNHGSLAIKELQLEGKKKMGIEEFLRGTKIETVG